MEQNKKPIAFVIMPFAAEFEEIYNYFIATSLNEAGFEVKRADDIESQNNILKDIVNAIKNCDIIVADLTSSNPNVYYELGLAHSINKPVILLTQDLSEVPFDLKSYRIIEYNTHFLNIQKVSKQLSNIALGLYDGSLKYGNPFTDFNEINIKDEIKEELLIEGEEGIIDYLADVDEGYAKLADIINEISSEMEKMTEDTEVFGSEITNATSNPSAGSASYLRKLSKSHAKKLEDFNKLLFNSNMEYTNIASTTKNSLENIIQILTIDTHDVDEYKKFLQTLNSVKVQAQSAQESYINLVNIMKSLPKIERFYNRAKDNSINEISKLVENISLTISSIDRAISIAEKRNKS